MKRDKQYRTALSFRPGQAVGMFEILFHQDSLYQYRYLRDEDLTKSRNSCYFIRISNWVSFFQDIKTKEPKLSQEF